MQICHMQQFHEKRRDFHQMVPKISREGWNNPSKFLFSTTGCTEACQIENLSPGIVNSLKNPFPPCWLNFPSRRNKN